MPLLKDHYAERKDLKVLEIGPLRTTSVAHALAHNTKIYLGLDVNKNAVRVQQEFLDKEGLLNAEAVFGDVYDLPMADASQDIVLAFRCTPLGSIYATRESLLKAYSEIARVLKPTGEFVLYPEPRPEISSFDPLREVFRPVKSFTIPAGPGRDKASQIMFLVKSAQ
jgi:ubiquinone/menaquinone biosynthesis C-methylase UbiE